LNVPPVIYPIFFQVNRKLRQINNGNKLSVGVLYIGFSHAACIFLNSQFVSKEEVGSVILPNVFMKSQSLSRSILDNTAVLYKLNNTEDDYMILCQYDVPPERANEWAKIVFDFINAKYVNIFDTISTLDFKRIIGNDTQPPLLRKIDTSLVKEKNDIQYLETPYIIESGSAAVISFCQIFKIPATLYLSLQDHRFIEVQTIEAFEKVLSNIKEFNQETIQQNRKQYTPPLEEISNTIKITDRIFI